jgi:TonB-linked SusC/RagA family outer membrane protein
MKMKIMILLSNVILSILLLVPIVFFHGLLYTAQGQVTAQVQRVALSEVQQNFYKTDIENEIIVEFEDVTLGEALKYIARESGLKLTYRGDFMIDMKVSMNRKVISVSEALSYVLDGSGLDYLVSRHGYLLISPIDDIKNEIIYQQTVSGVVIDALSGDPLPGVNVIVSGSMDVVGYTVGAQTEIDGSYSISVPENLNALVFSYVGYSLQEVEIAGRTEINISLQPQILTGDEVVVVGYGAQEARDITGSISSVSSEQIQQVVAMNPMQAIQGRVPGVDITQTNYRPGSSPSIRIRGTRSITADNDPLYVIDGVPISRGFISLNDINPSDIESIEVLKDASATAIYGSRGANGVILITTKRGQTGQTTVNYSSYVGHQSPLNEPKLWGPAEYAEYLRESFRNSETDTYLSPVPDPQQDANIPQLAQDPYTLESVLMAYDEQGNYHPDRVRGFDWIDAISQTGYVQNQQLSISRGTENSSILVAGGFYDNRGTNIGMNYTRFNLRANIDYDVSERLSVSSSTTVSRVDEDLGPDLYAASRTRSPVSRPKDDDGNWIYLIGNDPLMTNPLMDIGNVINESRKNRLLTNLTINAELLDGLVYRGTLGYDYRTARDGSFEGRDTRARLGDDPTASYGGNSTTDYLIDNLLTYMTTFGDAHALEITALSSFQDNSFESYSISVQNLPYEAQQFYNVGSASDITSVGSSLTEWKLLSWMGRVNYRIFDKYLFTLTGRYDGSSRLAEGNKYAFFPSAAVAWRISDEDFIQQESFINDLKLRVSYGETGNSAINPYQTQGSLNLTRYLWGDNVTIGYSPGSMPNPDLRWEITSQVNAGLDFALFNHRISGSIDVYRASTSDLLMPRVLPSVSGFSSVLDNVGKTRNTGLEISLSTVNAGYEGDFRWNTDFTFSTNKEEIVELVEGKVDDIGNQWFIGHPVDVFFGLDQVGIWQDTPEDLALMEQFNANGHTYEPGLVRLRDVNGDFQINEADRVIRGNSRSKWTGSIVNNIFYRNFDFSFQVYVNYGAMANYNQGLQLNGRYNQPAVDYWTPDNPTNRYPKPNYDWLGPPNIGSTYLEDASFARLKYATIGYTLPANIVNRLGGSRFRVYISAQNAFIYTNFSGPDPEGAQSVTVPSPKTFMVGVDLTF